MLTRMTRMARMLTRMTRWLAYYTHSAMGGELNDFISNCKQADCIYESRSAPAKCLEPLKARQLRNC